MMMVDGMNKIILEAKNITKIYHSGPETITVLKDLNFNLKESEIVVIMGHFG
jgi:ABC-type lipoprotein export system ATPase subunit